MESVLKRQGTPTKAALTMQTGFNESPNGGLHVRSPDTHSTEERSNDERMEQPDGMTPQAVQAHPAGGIYM
jgi:hypothetical protein